MATVTTKPQQAVTRMQTPTIAARLARWAAHHCKGLTVYRTQGSVFASLLTAEKRPVSHSPQLGKDARGPIGIGDEFEAVGFSRPIHRSLGQHKIADGLIARLQKMRAIGHGPAPFNVERNSRGIWGH